EPEPLMRNPTPGWRRAVLACALCLAAPPGARADLIFLKDGFAMQGKVRREGSAEFDPVAKEMFFMPKGFFLIDDGPRRVYFPHTRVRIAERMSAPVEERIVNKNGVLVLVGPNPFPPILEVTDAGEWNSRWQRTFAFRSPTRSMRLTQQIAVI